MKYTKIMVNTVSVLLLSFFSTVGTHAEANQTSVSNVQQQLQQSDNNIQAKEQEKNRIQQEIQSIQKDLENVNSSIVKTKGELDKTQKDIDQTNKLIEQKKEEIVRLEDKVIARRDVMKNRMISVQNNESTNLIIDILVNSNSLAELIERMNAVATILGADKEILTLQQNDLMNIEKDKQIINQKEAALEADREKLAQSKAQLESDMQKKQQALQDVQKQYNDISNQITLAQQEKQSIQANLQSLQNAIAAANQAAVNAVQATQPATNSSSGQAKAVAPAPAPSSSNQSASSGGREIYVKATAYSVEKSVKIGEGISRLGINLQSNPRLIAVDPSVIPLGKHVWVEGYGNAIAGDTGSAIQNNRIDVLVPTEADAMNYGVQYVKVIILD